MREWWNGDYSKIKQTYLPTEFYENKIPQHIIVDGNRPLISKGSHSNTIGKVFTTEELDLIKKVKHEGGDTNFNKPLMMAYKLCEETHTKY
jgi:hypothetical protein